MNGPATLRDQLVLFVAQGFGSGRLRPAPGTWGSLVGLLWILLLLRTGSLAAYGLGAVAAILVAVPVCTAAERILGEADPGSVVIDEIVALPLAFAGIVAWAASGTFPGTTPFAVSGWPALWPEFLTAFAAFRLFDIWKPGPIGASQHLPRGWGVVLDDVLAGLAAGVVVTAVLYLRTR